MMLPVLRINLRPVLGQRWASGTPLRYELVERPKDDFRLPISFLVTKDEKADSEPKIQIETKQAALGHECLFEQQRLTCIFWRARPPSQKRKAFLRQHADKHTYQIFDEDSKHEATN